jgi:heptaprenyl diphosphate synthase
MYRVKACPPDGTLSELERRTQLPQLELTAFLAAVALFCSTLEYLIPKPLPFIRLGLANLPLMLSFPLLSWKSYLWLLLLKVIGQGFVNGTLLSYVFVLSVAGTATSGLFMRILWQAGGMERRYRRHRLKPEGETDRRTDVGSGTTERRSRQTVEECIPPVFSYIGISAAGALVSNCSQILTAQLMFFGNAIWVIAAPMLAAGLVTSVLLGWMANVYVGRSDWYASLLAGSGTPSRYRRIFESTGSWRPDARCVPVGIGLALLPAIFFQKSLVFLAVDALLAISLSVSVGRRFKPLPNLLVLVTMVLVHLCQPSGKVLWNFGWITLTEGALQEGLRKALILIGMVYVSQFMTVGKPDLPGKLGKLLAIQLAYFGAFSRSWRNEDDAQERRNLIDRIDGLLERVGTEDAHTPNTGRNGDTDRNMNRTWLIIGITILLVMYALLGIQCFSI